MRKGLNGEEEKGGEVWGKKFVLARVAREKDRRGKERVLE